MLCAFWDKFGKGDVTDNMIRLAVKHAAAAIDNLSRGIKIEQVDTHSLRSGVRGGMRIVQGRTQATQNHETGPMGPKLTLVHEVHPGEIIILLHGNVHGNE